MPAIFATFTILTALAGTQSSISISNYQRYQKPIYAQLHKSHILMQCLNGNLRFSYSISRGIAGQYRALNSRGTWYRSSGQRVAAWEWGFEGKQDVTYFFLLQTSVLRHPFKFIVYYHCWAVLLTAGATVTAEKVHGMGGKGAAP